MKHKLDPFWKQFYCIFDKFRRVEAFVKKRSMFACFECSFSVCSLPLPTVLPIFFMCISTYEQAIKTMCHFLTACKHIQLGDFCLVNPSSSTSRFMADTDPEITNPLYSTTVKTRTLRFRIKKKGRVRPLKRATSGCEVEAPQHGAASR